MDEPDAGGPGLSRAEKTAILNRLRRAQGQIGGVLKMVDEDRDCRDIVIQLAAARKALDRVGFAVINGSLRQCHTSAEPADVERLRSIERLFVRLT